MKRKYEKSFLKELDSFIYARNLELFTDCGESRLEEFSFNKIELENISKYADQNNSVFEFNTVYFDEEYIVASDMTTLVCHKNESAYRNIYIPKIFCNIYIRFQDVKILINKFEKNIFLSFNGNIYKFSYKKLKYIDYKHLLEKEFKYTLQTKEMIGNSKLLPLDDSKTKYFAYKFDEDYICGNMDVNFGLEYVSINNSTTPFMFYDAKKQIQQIIMPLILSKDEVNNILINA